MTLRQIEEKVLAGERLSFADGLELFESGDLMRVGNLANKVRERLHGDLTYFNRNLHINATNVCVASCIFCSFARLKSDDPRAYTMSMNQVTSRLEALKDAFITEVHVVNGLNPDLPFSYYTDVLREIQSLRPGIHIKAFTAVEIHFFSELYKMSYHEVLTALIEAGLGSMPGGGAEIFHPRARKKLCQDKVGADGWLQVHRVAHQLGLRTNCTILFGAIERLDERVDHLIRLRDLQDETGGFQTFIPLKFHAENNRLSKIDQTTATDTLLMLAISRLMLDNIPHIKAYWPMLGASMAQLSLSFGVNDLDGTVREERIYHMAGATTPQMLTRNKLIELIKSAGRVPVERDTHYNIAAEVA